MDTFMNWWGLGVEICLFDACFISLWTMDVPLFMLDHRKWRQRKDLSQNRYFGKPSWQGIVDDSHLVCVKDWSLRLRRTNGRVYSRKLCRFKNLMPQLCKRALPTISPCQTILAIILCFTWRTCVVRWDLVRNHPATQPKPAPLFLGREDLLKGQSAVQSHSAAELSVCLCDNKCQDQVLPWAQISSHASCCNSLYPGDVYACLCWPNNHNINCKRPNQTPAEAVALKEVAACRRRRGIHSPPGPSPPHWGEPHQCSCYNAGGPWLAICLNRLSACKNMCIYVYIHICICAHVWKHIYICVHV